MSNYSEDSLRKEDLISTLGQDENNEDDGFSQMDTQIQMLENKFTVLKSIIGESSNFKEFKLKDEDILNNPHLLREISLQNNFFKNKINDIEFINKSLTSEISSLHSENKEKDDEILLLKKELNIMNKERNDNLYGIKSTSLRKDFDLFSKYHNKYNVSQGISVQAKHGVNRESMSSVATTCTTQSLSHTTTFEWDKLSKEKVNLENQLVLYKFKYAEQSSKIIELEDDRDMFKQKYEFFSDKIQIKEDIIKSLINERDSLKYTNNMTKPKTLVRQATERGFTSTLSSANHSPERLDSNKRKSNAYMYMQTEISSNPGDAVKTETNSNNCNTNANSLQHEGNKTPSGFAKIFKNMFSSSEKK